jgi:hypothetical protein
MLSGYDSIDSNSHPSGAEDLLTACVSESHTPDTEHSHDFEACAGGQAHGQGAPVYPCGCYRRTALTNNEIADAIADASEQCKKLEQVATSRCSTLNSESDCYCSRKLTLGTRTLKKEVAKTYH